MSGATAEQVRAHIKTYWMIGGALFVLTVATVLLSHLEFPLPLTIVIGLAVATLKASLVAGFFMHLIDERKIIYWVLAITFIFFLALMILPLVTDLEVVEYLKRWH